MPSNDRDQRLAERLVRQLDRVGPNGRARMRRFLKACEDETGGEIVLHAPLAYTRGTSPG